MPREKEAYRDNLEMIIQYFGNKRVLTVTDVSRYTGHAREVCLKKYSFTKNKEISIATLARDLC